MKPFRKLTPKRTYTQKHTDYASYKSPLRADFVKRCGYCDDADFLCGGQRGFHIDHFRPKKYKHLINVYSNLIYACPYCNIAKSDDWPSGSEDQTILDNKGYIDPCDESFNDHFERYENGKIRPRTELGKYMYKKLKLGLRRHQLSWMYEQLEVLQEELVNELNSPDVEASLQNQAKDQLVKLTKEYIKYKTLLRETL
jgi:hypothetical protein